jgi:hypothetical protein
VWGGEGSLCRRRKVLRALKITITYNRTRREKTQATGIRIQYFRVLYSSTTVLYCTVLYPVQ